MAEVLWHYYGAITDTVLAQYYKSRGLIGDGQEEQRATYTCEEPENAVYTTRDLVCASGARRAAPGTADGREAVRPVP